MNVAELDLIASLVFDAFQIPVAILNMNHDILIKYSSLPFHNPLWASQQALHAYVVSSGADIDYPIFRTVNDLEHYFFLKLPIATFIAGPIVNERVTEQLIVRVMNDYKVSSKCKNDFLSYYTAVPAVSKAQLLHISRMVYYMMYQQKLGIESIIDTDTNHDHTSIDREIDVQLSIQRQDDFFHNFSHEKLTMGYIKEGNTTALAELLKTDQREGVGLLSKKSQLRNRKNMAVCAVALATRSAVDGGLEIEVAYTMSDLYIQHVEELMDATDVTQFMNKALLEFAERVRENKHGEYSKSVRQCQRYIFNHIYEKLSVSDLAKVVQLNPIYLSQLFKREVGMTLSEYIQREKVEEAKHLLTQTDEPLSVICNQLKFSDQSYFTKVFKKYAGMTPQKFKKES